MAKSEPNGAPASVPQKLPASIINALPSAMAIMTHMAAVEKLIPNLEKELKKASKAGPIQLARAYVALHRMDDRIDAILKPLFGDKGLYKRYKELELPAAFEQAGVPNVSLDEGFRVGISHRWLASIKPEMKEQAYEWLRKNGYADIIKPSINSSTLSATAKELVEQKNMELPDDLFTVAMVPNTSVTKT